jgi:hypothetical protein
LLVKFSSKDTPRLSTRSRVSFLHVR